MMIIFSARANKRAINIILLVLGATLRASFTPIGTVIADPAARVSIINRLRFPNWNSFNIAGSPISLGVVALM